jgi:hypothetical protein
VPIGNSIRLEVNGDYPSAPQAAQAVDLGLPRPFCLSATLSCKLPKALRPQLAAFKRSVRCPKLRRRIVRFNVTSNPTAEWTARQIVEAFPADGPIAKFLMRDRDGICGGWFRQRVKGMGIREIIISRKSPRQNPYVERAIGSPRHECLDDVIILGERPLRLIIKRYVAYYQGVRPHLSLQRNAPIRRKVEPGRGRVIAIPHVGGLLHHYRRAP